MNNDMIATLQDFRTETRTWLEENCPTSMRQPVQGEEDVYWGGRNGSFASNDQEIWFNNMLSKGWTAPTWPRMYGGGGLNPEEYAILQEELQKLNCRLPIYSFGISMLGPALLKFGTEEQKMQYIPDIILGKIRWCQGYSEPGAGSDLASLKTSAVLEGNHFVINGSKVWTSYADKADWIFCLVRTNAESKHTGVSFVLIDMQSEGVSTSPIKLISGKSPFCQTFFDNVKVPVANLIGEENQGWTIAKYLLTHERGMIGGLTGGSNKKSVHEIALETLETENGKISDSVLRQQIAHFEMNEMAYALTIKRSLDEAKNGQETGALSSMFKYVGTEQNKLRNELLVSLVGQEGLTWDFEAFEEGSIARNWLRSKANSIEGGTSEIQLNIIAKNILGLPTLK